MSWVTWVTGVFALMIVVVLVVAWLVSTGRIGGAAEAGRRTGIEWAEQSTTPGTSADNVASNREGAPPDDSREFAHGRHEAQDR
ncbi:hypothetical protein EXU48_04915 [Occultella glacieicola]|uniref:Secreted protein n=1 Tax=Occultella glacieicola TaxID=2518684 RepID=A0ABY2E8S5_9MICO|nr:hypothetical protein [Occultella glacieicola]TDE97526.1 hypothetical protein EXU48_04915 [Occultella glacieicola]